MLSDKDVRHANPKYQDFLVSEVLGFRFRLVKEDYTFTIFVQLIFEVCWSYYSTHVWQFESPQQPLTWEKIVRNPVSRL